MTDQARAGGTNLFAMTAFATVLQIVVMILLATDRMSVDLAVPMLGLVLIVGLLPALAALKKSMK